MSRVNMSPASEDHATRISEHVLRRLGIDPDEVVDIQDLPAGLSGGRLWRLTVRSTLAGGAHAYAVRIVKRIVSGSGWLGEASRDTLGRELRLWESGLLAGLPYPLVTPVLAWVRDGADGQSGALLMRDLRGRLWPERFPVSPARLPLEVATLLDRLAILHARFWNDARLRDSDLGLMPTDAALTLTAPDTIAQRIARGDREQYLPLAAAGWEAFLRIASAHTADVLRAVLQSPEPHAVAIDRLPWTLVHGDVWGPNLGWLPGTHAAPRTGTRMLLLDWALATAGPATYDPLWLCGTWHALHPPRALAVYRARLRRHLAARGIALADHTWLALADAGYLRTTLTCGEALGRAAVEAPAGAARERAEARVRWWAERAVRGARRLLAAEGA